MGIKTIVKTIIGAVMVYEAGKNVLSVGNLNSNELGGYLAISGIVFVGGLALLLSAYNSYSTRDPDD